MGIRGKFEKKQDIIQVNLEVLHIPHKRQRRMWTMTVQKIIIRVVEFQEFLALMF
jgi:hypothetical protein